MKVIRMGEKHLPIKRFTCRSCGCVFEAEEGEYKVASNIEWAKYGFNAKCECPYCGEMVYSHEK